MSRNGADPDRITVARLDGCATRHARSRALDEATAVAQLIEIATERRRGRAPRLRVDLLNQAAGALVGSYRYSQRASWSGQEAARLLIAAGADPATVEEIAAATLEHLAAVNGRPSVGNPFPSPSGGPGQS